MLPAYRVLCMSSQCGDFHERAHAELQRHGFDAKLAQRYLPRRSAAAHATNASRLCTTYYTRAIARMALEVYAEDYRVLGLPKPTWLERLAR